MSALAAVKKENVPKVVRNVCIGAGPIYLAHGVAEYLFSLLNPGLGEHLVDFPRKLQNSELTK